MELLMPRELKRLFLEVMFLGKEPPTFWMGLSERRFEIPPTIESLVGSEISAPDYRRAKLDKNTWLLTDNPLTVSSEAGEFRNLGEIRWPSVSSWFIITSESEGGIVVAWNPTREPRVLLSRESLSIPVKFIYPG